MSLVPPGGPFSSPPCSSGSPPPLAAGASIDGDGPPCRTPGGPPIEPLAGTWATWVLTSGSELRLPAPPDARETRAEILELFALEAQRDGAARDRIAFWSSGPPSYRWVELGVNQVLAKPLNNPRNQRTLALLNVAIYDATVAAWDSKFFYNRARPGQVERSLEPALASPRSPSYPSEHAVVAGAASAILSYVYPADAATFEARAQEAAETQLLAGIQYRSDVVAGLALGRAVASRVIERAKADGSNVTWTGTVPVGPGFWNGTNPAEPLAGTWRKWVLSSGSQLRPGAPPAFDSDQKKAELAEIKTFPRTFATNQKALYWQSLEGIYAIWYDVASRRIFENHLQENQPRVARIYAALSIAHHDALVACWEGKYFYWAIRPFQLDKDVVTLFPTPNHPSYPAAHGAVSGAISEVLALLFPRDANSIRARADEAASSRVWAGIHYRSDIDAGLAQGRAVGRLVIDRIRMDGSE